VILPEESKPLILQLLYLSIGYPQDFNDLIFPEAGIFHPVMKAPKTEDHFFQGNKGC
jgi:hypothetical protein